MASKSEATTHFIIERVAPLFNKSGYNGTSMSAITNATGLTKGAIYGNFKNKEELAFAAFKHNVDTVVNRIKVELSSISSPIEQLKGLIGFYRKYRHYTIDIGGCPIINIGVDANHQNSNMLSKVQEVVERLQFYIEKMIFKGQEQGEIKAEIDAKHYAKRIFAAIEGSVFLTVTMNDDTYIQEMMDAIDKLIDNELRS
ncbi:TetR/AcrR family transcriptional regulator [Crocinitomix algicola]|uniref:TetR/AcrR family transcriptional regulator n=1 Tax=Crocinitomix algicola TaxID=1740263 RepID=UPI000873387F|nr:TetR/AcrR family transcriptional regulator [Crocinitomix algicola]